MENKAELSKLFKKLVGIMQIAEKVKKTGFNKGQRYQYATEADIIEVVRKGLIDNSIMIFTSSKVRSVDKVYKYDTSKSGEYQICGESIVTTLDTEHTFADAETGETFSITGSGQGWDSTDKGSYKALTGAVKYMLSKNFLIPSQDDPENDGANPSYVRGKADSSSKAVDSSNKSAPKSATKPAANNPFKRSSVVKTEETGENVAVKEVKEEKKDSVQSDKPSFGRRVAGADPGFN